MEPIDPNIESNLTTSDKMKDLLLTISDKTEMTYNDYTLFKSNNETKVKGSKASTSTPNCYNN
jgi:hypothetical protein